MGIGWCVLTLWGWRWNSFLCHLSIFISSRDSTTSSNHNTSSCHQSQGNWRYLGSKSDGNVTTFTMLVTQCVVFSCHSSLFRTRSSQKSLGNWIREIEKVSDQPTVDWIDLKKRLDIAASNSLDFTRYEKYPNSAERVYFSNFSHHSYLLYWILKSLSQDRIFAATSCWLMRIQYRKWRCSWILRIQSFSKYRLIRFSLIDLCHVCASKPIP